MQDEAKNRHDLPISKESLKWLMYLTGVSGVLTFDLENTRQTLNFIWFCYFTKAAEVPADKVFEFSTSWTTAAAASFSNMMVALLICWCLVKAMEIFLIERELKHTEMTPLRAELNADYELLYRERAGLKEAKEQIDYIKQAGPIAQSLRQDLNRLSEDVIKLRLELDKLIHRQIKKQALSSKPLPGDGYDLFSAGNAKRGPLKLATKVNKPRQKRLSTPRWPKL